ncbi:polysaccharide lyase family 8 super-sandwich domain-containing protein [Aeromonas sp. MdU4]|uniref:polysaccharide lyase family 8 super-sandwich domain-containing protein n=1 Tax=Aeromonas sp. MdU4 TaxID=3342819 RepID=UPI0035B7E36B
MTSSLSKYSVLALMLGVTSLAGCTNDDGSTNSEQNIITGNNKSAVDMATSTESEPLQPSDREIIDGIARQIADRLDEVQPDFIDAINVKPWVTSVSDGGTFDIEKGQWTDLSYIATNNAIFPPKDHIDRLLMLARCYQQKTGCSESSNKSLLAVMSAGMSHFASANYSSKNWWFNYIGLPQSVGELLIYIKARTIPVNPEAYQELVAAPYLNERFYLAYGRGANAIDISFSNLYSGIVRDDPVRLKNYTHWAQSEIAREDVGISADKSFLAHGNMLNTNSYGTVLVNRTLQVEKITRGYLPMSASSQQALESFMDQGMYPTYRGKYKDHLTTGRGGLSRENELGRGFFTDTLEKLNPEKAEHYKLVNLVTSGQAKPEEMPYREVKGYWNADYLLKNEKYFQYSALTHSSRTLPIEVINEENLRGALISMGSRSVRLSGDEYYNIFPLWDWYKVPGATGREGQSLRPGSKVGDAFAGTMSADNNAILVHSQSKDGLIVHKSDFVFRDAIISMASNITADKSGQVTSSIDQSWYRGAIDIGLQNGQSLKIDAGDHQFNGHDLRYVLHNRIAYIPLDGSKYHISADERTGKWSDVNVSQSNKEVSGRIFTAWIEHGEYPAQDTFAYAIYPNVTKESIEKIDLQRFQTYNKDGVLAVYDHKDDVLQLVLRDAHQWSGMSFTLESDKAGMYVVTQASTNHPVIHFADPTQKFVEANISFYNSNGGGAGTIKAPNYQLTNVVSLTL